MPGDIIYHLPLRVLRLLLVIMMLPVLIDFDVVVEEQSEALQRISTLSSSYLSL